MKPDELWERWKLDDSLGNRELMDYASFTAALHEYGQAVRARDAEIARSECLVDGLDTSDDIAYNLAVADCAAAISKEPLP